MGAFTPIGLVALVIGLIALVAVCILYFYFRQKFKGKLHKQG